MKWLWLFLFLLVATLSLAQNNDYEDSSGNWIGPRNDGVAELPRVGYYTAVSATPSPNAPTMVAAGANLQTVLDNAVCGDKIELEAGATWDTTTFYTIPAKTPACDATHYITLRSAASDAALPPENTSPLKVPCYSGVASMPTRPAFGCTSTAVVSARIRYTGTAYAQAPIRIAEGAGYWRIGPGIEVTRAHTAGDSLQQHAVGSLIQINSVTTTPQTHIIFDRVYVHGSEGSGVPFTPTRQGLMLNDATYVAVIDSYFGEFFCVSGPGGSQPGGDSQAIAGGNSDFATPVYKIVNTFLEAGAEDIIFGGGGSTFTPSDIEIRLNTFFKPTSWIPTVPYNNMPDGTPRVKNNFELKNAQRVLFEGNILANVWQSTDQVAFQIVLSPKNGTGNAPNSKVDDVTIRYSKTANSAGCMQIANALSDFGFAAKEMQNVSIHDLLCDNVSKSGTYGVQSSRLFQISGVQVMPMNNVVINHVTIPLGEVTMINLGSDKIPSGMTNITIKNSILYWGSNGIFGTGSGVNDCSYASKFPTPKAKLDSCWVPYTFTNNAMITGGQFIGQMPAGNWYPATGAAVGFVNYNGGNGGDYHLLTSSFFHNLGTDGKDVGADIDAITAATNGVDTNVPPAPPTGATSKKL